MAGHLTADQIAWIAAGNRIRRAWSIGRPNQAWPASVYHWATVHDDDTSITDRTCIVRAGKIETSGYNITMKNPGEFPMAPYSFTVANDSQLWYPEVGGNYFYSSTYTRQAAPQECRIRLRLWVWSGSAWSFINWEYVGFVTSIRYTETANMLGMKGNLCHMTCASVWHRVLTEEWTEDHGWDDDTTSNVLIRQIT